MTFRIYDTGNKYRQIVTYYSISKLLNNMFLIILKENTLCTEKR